MWQYVFIVWSQVLSFQINSVVPVWVEAVDILKVATLSTVGE